MCNEEEDCKFPFLNGNDGDIMKLYIKVYFWLCGITLCLIASIGIVGNIVSIFAFLSKELRSTFHMHLVSLAVFDLIFLAANLLQAALQIYDIQTQGTTYPDPKWMPNEIWIALYPFLIHPFKYIFFTASEFLTVIMSIDRYVAIQYPFRYHLFWNTDRFHQRSIDILAMNEQKGSDMIRKTLIDWKRVTTYFLWPVLFSTSFCVPVFFEYNVEVENGTTIIKESKLYTRTYGLVYYIVLDTIFRFVIPIVALLYANFGIYKIARKKNTVINDSTITMFQRNAQNFMLFGVVCLLMVTESYRFGGNIYSTSCYYYYGEDYINCCGLNIDNEISFAVLQILWTINSSANCFIYLFASKQFREVAVKKFCLKY